MTRHLVVSLALGAVVAAAGISPAYSADVTFAYKASFRNVNQDPDKIWTGDALAAGAGGTVTIHEYELLGNRGDLVVSQIWNEECSSGTCPTRLARVVPNQPPQILVDDMMHQVIPPDDPRFSALESSSAQAAAFARAPFAMSRDGKTLINGDFKFHVDGAQP